MRRAILGALAVSGAEEVGTRPPSTPAANGADGLADHIACPRAAPADDLLDSILSRRPPRRPTFRRAENSDDMSSRGGRDHVASTVIQSDALIHQHRDGPRQVSLCVNGHQQALYANPVVVACAPGGGKGPFMASSSCWGCSPCSCAATRGAVADPETPNGRGGTVVRTARIIASGAVVHLGGQSEGPASSHSGRLQWVDSTTLRAARATGVAWRDDCRRMRLRDVTTMGVGVRSALAGRDGIFTRMSWSACGFRHHKFRGDMRDHQRNWAWVCKKPRGPAGQTRFVVTVRHFGGQCSRVIRREPKQLAAKRCACASCGLPMENPASRIQIRIFKPAGKRGARSGHRRQDSGYSCSNPLAPSRLGWLGDLRKVGHTFTLVSQGYGSQQAHTPKCSARGISGSDCGIWNRCQRGSPVHGADPPRGVLSGPRRRARVSVEWRVCVGQYCFFFCCHWRSSRRAGRHRGCRGAPATWSSGRGHAITEDEAAQSNIHG